MSFVIGLLMLAMVLVCIAMIFLVLIQLPKKEAGIGVAFGGGATDALFGAGSGNVLTKATKYCAVAFFGLALLAGFLQTHYGAKGRADKTADRIEEQLKQVPAPTTTAPSTAPAATLPATTVPAEAPAAATSAPTPAPAEAPAQK